ncbi:MAG: hypothetical protein CMJ98_07835 [Planctomycetes bacterium]|jgi:ribosomal protein S27AE|nr:hypothetical protein [Planctomycetota bacterium]HJM56649.1 hypothetical protein [Planctomycetota bacterium]
MKENVDRLPESELDCSRCGTCMKDTGPIKLRAQRDTLPQAWLLAHVHANIVEFQTYVCPACGKVEFFR